MRLADIHFANREDAVIATLEGEVDMSNAAELGTTLLNSPPRNVSGLVLDLTAVDYLDSAGIQLIYQLRAGLNARGQCLKLVIPAGSPVLDALRLAGVLDTVTITGSLDGAVHDLHRADHDL